MEKVLWRMEELINVGHRGEGTRPRPMKRAPPLKEKKIPSRAARSLVLSMELGVGSEGDRDPLGDSKYFKG